MNRKELAQYVWNSKEWSMWISYYWEWLRSGQIDLFEVEEDLDDEISFT